MNELTFTYPSLLHLGWLAGWGVSVLACESAPGTPGTQDMEAPGSEICSFCEPQTGGETSDFGGSIPICARFLKRQPVDSQIAKQYDLDLDVARERIERPVDSRLYWVEAENGKLQVTGYPTSERVRFDFEVTSEALMLIDPEKCDETQCTDSEGAVEIEPSLCEPYLVLGFDVTFRTSMSGLNGSTSGVALQWQWSDDPIASAVIDVTRLQSPSLLVSQPADENDYTGVLQFDFQFIEDESSGQMRFVLVRPAVDNVLDYSRGWESNVSAHWPSLPAEPGPETGGFEPEEE